MERVRLVARRRDDEGEGERDVGGGAEAGDDEESSKVIGGMEEDEGKDAKGAVGKEEEGVLGSSRNMVFERAKMPSSRYPPPLAPTATAAAAIEPIVQRY